MIIRCRKHGARPEGYVICQHVAHEGAKIAKRTVPTTPTNLGNITCALGYESHIASDQYVVECDLCAKENGRLA